MSQAITRRLNKVVGRRSIWVGRGQESTAVQTIAYNLIARPIFIGRREQKKEATTREENTSPWKGKERQIMRRKETNLFPLNDVHNGLWNDRRGQPSCSFRIASIMKLAKQRSDPDDKIKSAGEQQNDSGHLGQDVGPVPVHDPGFFKDAEVVF